MWPAVGAHRSCLMQVENSRRFEGDRQAVCGQVSEAGDDGVQTP